MHPVFVTRPVRSVEDLGAAIIVAAYGRAAAETRPVPRNLDALADLLRETQVRRVVVTDWRVPEASIGGLLDVFADTGVELDR